MDYINKTVITSDYDLFIPDSGAKILKKYSPANFPLSDEFKNTFPQLTHLVSKANVTEVEINGLFRRIFIWENSEGEKIGWNTNNYTLPCFDDDYYERKNPEISDLLAEHILLVQNVGGIVEILNDEEELDSFTCAKEFLFSLKHCFKLSAKEYLSHYDIGEDFISYFDTEQLVCFVEEGNGSLTLYNNQTGNVFLFGICYDYDDIQAFDSEQESNVYLLKGANTFIDFVETMATQWIGMLG